MELPTWLSTKEAASVLAVSEDTLINILRDGLIPPQYWMRTGKRGELRIHPAALDPLLRPGDVQPRPQSHALLAHLEHLTATVEGGFGRTAPCSFIDSAWSERLGRPAATLTGVRHIGPQRALPVPGICPPSSPLPHAATKNSVENLPLEFLRRMMKTFDCGN